MFAPFLALCWLLSPHSGLAPLRLDAHGFPLPPGALARLGDLHFAQPGPITALALSPDDKLIATAGSHVYLWNPDTGRIVRELRGLANVGTLAFSKDGRFLAAGTWDGVVQVWKVATGEAHWPRRERRPEGLQRVTELRFLDNDRLLAVVHNEDQVSVLNVGRGTLMHAWNIKKDNQEQLKQLGTGYQCAAVSLSPSGRLMAWLICPEKYTEGRRAAVFLYETATGKLHRQIKQVQAPGEKIQLLDEGKTALIQTAWDFSLPPFGGHEIPAKKSDGKGEGGNAIVELAEGTVRFRFSSRLSPELGRPLRAPHVTTRLMAVSPDRQSVFTQDELGVVQWNVATGKKLGEWTEDWAGVVFFADGKRAVVARGARLKVCSLPITPTERKLEFSEAPDIRYFPDGRLQTVHRVGAGRIHIWDPQKGQRLESYWRFPRPGVGRTPCCADFAGKLLVHHHEDRRIVVHDCLLNAPVARLQGVEVEDPWPVWPRLSADEKRILVSEPRKGTLLLRWFDSRSGREQGRHEIPEGELFSGDSRQSWFTEDGTQFGYITPDSRLRLVDCQTHKMVAEVGFPVPPTQEPRKFRYPAWDYRSSGFHRLIRASRGSEESPGQKEIALCDRSTGHLLRHFRWQLGGEFDHGWEPILSPDGRLAVVQLWTVPEMTIYETSSGQPRGRLRVPGPWPYFSPQHLSFSPDGKTLATSCADTTVLLWDLNRPLSSRPLLPAPRTAAEREALWQQLSDPDAALAEQALWTLVRSPEPALILLREKLQPVRSPEPQRVQTLLRHLDSGIFRQREGAMRELLALGELAVPALRTALEKKNLPLEQRQRVGQLLQRLEQPVTILPSLRELRAIEVLERIGTAEARRLLERLAGGDVGALVTREAQVTLARMMRTGAK